MEFFKSFLDIVPSSVISSSYKRIGFEIDEFSRVYGRVLLVGHFVYQSEKNYRSIKHFNEWYEHNQINIPGVIVLLEENAKTVSQIQNIDNMFINKFETIKREYLGQGSIKMFGYVKKPKKGWRAFKIQRQKRFIIPVDSSILVNDEHVMYNDELSIHCTFRKKLI